MHQEKDVAVVRHKYSRSIPVELKLLMSVSEEMFRTIDEVFGLCLGYFISTINKS